MSLDSSVSLSDSPFGDIALCLSGGGYRAAAYALGTLSMLNELNLLDDVKLLSTVSGGTFTGLTYAVIRTPCVKQTLTTVPKKALLFDYLPASSDGPEHFLPGGIVFTFLSHDIIAHETTHALLDGGKGQSSLQTADLFL